MRLASHAWFRLVRVAYRAAGVGARLSPEERDEARLVACCSAAGKKHFVRAVTARMNNTATADGRSNRAK